MSFAAPLWLLALAAPLAWLAWHWRRTDRRLGLLFHVFALSLVILALAEPRWELVERDQAVVVLTDASSSIPDEQLEQQRNLIADLQARAGGALVRALWFDESARGDEAAAGDLVASVRGTNLEAAVRGALAALPADRVGRIVLASDGRENQGAVERALYQAQRRGVPLDVAPLEGRPAPELRIDSVTAPAEAWAGERFALELGVDSPRAARATVRLYADGQLIGESQTDLAAGRNLIAARARLEVSGAALLRGEVEAEDLGQALFASVVSLRQPRALLLASPDALLEAPLAAAGFAVERRSGPVRSAPGTSLRESYELIVADNQDFEHWPVAFKTELEAFVAAGGGFALAAGENNLYLERSEDEQDPLNRMLPAVLAPPRTPEGTSVVLVLDKSSSMEGKKMELARQSAMGLVDNLREIDHIGVLVFDNSFEWAVSLRPNDQPAQTKRLIASVIADGGTQIAPALHEAYSRILPQEAVYKHILLLTDGISEEGDSIQLAREAVKEEITISTVGLGQDVNRAYLERVAKTAEGRSYFVLDVNQLAQIVLRDVLEHTGSSVTEREFQPVAPREAEILEDIDLSEPGPLLGWVRFEAKPRAETLLSIDEEDPLLVRRQYGLGRAAVFASDGGQRWAENWVDWPGYDRFWANLFRDLLPRARLTEASATFERTEQEIVVRYGTPTPHEGDLPELYVLGPDGFRRTVSLAGTGEAEYETRIGVAGLYGLFRIRPSAELERFPELALLRESSELETYGADEELLRGIAAATGGRFRPSLGEVFDSAGRAELRLLELWPLLLALAILFNLIELLARKGWLPWLGRWA